MGYFVLPIYDTWEENLDVLKVNIDLLKDSPDSDYLFIFMQHCLDTAKKQYDEER